MAMAAMPSRPRLRTAATSAVQTAFSESTSIPRATPRKRSWMRRAVAVSAYVKPMPRIPPPHASTRTIVVAFHTNVPSDSFGVSVGMRYTFTTRSSSRTVAEPARTSNHLTHLILDHGLDDLPAILLAARERLPEVNGLLRRDLARHRRLLRVDDGLHDGRSWIFERRL